MTSSSHGSGPERDLVIYRVFVYGSLMLVITAVYVVAVVGLGWLLGANEPGTAPHTLLAILATGFVAVAFRPLRRHLHRLADRAVYGRTATPHQVLSEFSRRVAANDRSLLTLAARSLVEGTGADHVRVLVRAGDQLVKTTEWPQDVVEIPTKPDEVVSLPIRRDEAELGALELSSGQPLSEQDHLLAQRVASGMGLALANRELTETLELRVEELQRSRRRLVEVLDDTRRQLERDLHDGAQQQLVALKVKLALARSISSSDGAVQTAALLHDLAAAADVTVDAMRDFARGIYPPLLEAKGLGPATTDHARRAAIPVTVEIDGLTRYDRQLETTVNLCIVEALENVAKHAHASSAHVSIKYENESVVFRVSDDGVGFDLDLQAPSGGITYMADRMDAVAGTLEIASTSGAGTIVTGTVPAGSGSAR